VGEAVGEDVGEAEGVAVGDALRSVVVSEPLPPSAAEVLSWASCALCSVCVGGGSSGASVEATAHPITAEITVAARAHAEAPTTTAITRGHPRIRPRRRPHRIKENVPRMKANAANSATPIAAVPISSIILSQHPTILGPSLRLSENPVRGKVARDTHEALIGQAPNTRRRPISARDAHRCWTGAG
jgi:hypothetical protein